MEHFWLTVIATLPDEAVSKTQQVLEEFANPAKGQMQAGLVATGRIHFASALIVPGDNKTKTYLVFEASGDGPMNDLLDSLDANISSELRMLFEHTVEYRKREKVSNFLERLHIPAGTGLLAGTQLGRASGLNFTGTPGASVAQILAERKIAREAAVVLRDIEPAPALEMVNRVRQKLRSDETIGKWLEPDELHNWDQEERPVGVGAIAQIAGSAVYYFLWPLLLLWFWGTLWYTKNQTPRKSDAYWVDWAGWWDYGAKTWDWFKNIFYCYWPFATECKTFFSEFPWVTLIVAIGSLLTIIVVVVGLLYLRFYGQERRDLSDDSDPSRDNVAEIMLRENHTMQNHLAAISIMKGGWLRLLALNAAFWIIGQLAQRSFKPGFLSDIGTIHYARWILIPGTNRLLFFSNYGGSWESYLEDFITKASNGLTAVWSNTYGFPETRNLFTQGAVDGDRFKRWARRQQRPSYFWFTAYPDLRTENIRRNAKIREGLAIAMTEDQAEDWLMMFGSKPRPATYIEADDIQTIVFGGLKRFRHSAALAISFDGQNAKPSAWLAKQYPDLIFGNRLPETKEGRVVAFTATGLSKLGMSQDVLSSFPPVFQSGMTASHRGRILGDLGKSHPDHWEWGGTQNPVDAILLVYANSPEALASALQEDQHRLANHGLPPAHQIDMQDLPAPGKVLKEPFGFVDGISQPIIRGTSRDRLNINPMHIVEPGEIVLGYPDNRGYVPPTPRVSASNDPGRVLHQIKPGGKTKKINSFDIGGLPSMDFGRNGTYLVVRQLWQDVDGFEQFLDNAALQLNGANNDVAPDAYAREWVAAKMVGRWRNGSPLVVYPYRDLNNSHLPGAIMYEAMPGTTEISPAKERELEATKADFENNFLYGTGDPQGLRCPYGSHIRRAFPRESQRPNSDDEVSIVNRHRILRVGRPYENKQTQEQGLMFMCLNADIERQFEFIQQTWLKSKTFHGLDYEVDPLMGDDDETENGEKRFTIPTPQGPKVITGLKNFVKVVGGGYFFMPSRRAIRYLANTT